MFIMALVGLMMSTTANAQENAAIKAHKKEIAAKKKQFKKEGWVLFGTSRSIDQVLGRYYEALDKGGDDVFEFLGFSTGKTKSLLVAAAENNARNRYASQSAAQIKGKIKSNQIANSADVSQEVDKFEAIYLTNVEKQLSGQLKASFSMIKTNENTGVSDLQTYFVVSEADASRARIAAAESAVREAGINAEAAAVIKKIAEEDQVRQE